MKIRLSRAGRARVLLLGLLLTTATNAANAADQRESLTLARAIELATSRSPSITALGAETEAATQRNEAEALPPHLLLESEFENFAGTDQTSGGQALESTVRITKVFE